MEAAAEALLRGGTSTAPGAEEEAARLTALVRAAAQPLASAARERRALRRQQQQQEQQCAVATPVYEDAFPSLSSTTPPANPAPRTAHATPAPVPAGSSASSRGGGGAGGGGGARRKRITPTPVAAVAAAPADPRFALAAGDRGTGAWGTATAVGGVGGGRDGSGSSVWGGGGVGASVRAGEREPLPAPSKKCGSPSLAHDERAELLREQRRAASARADAGGSTQVTPPSSGAPHRGVGARASTDASASPSLHTSARAQAQARAVGSGAGDTATSSEVATQPTHRVASPPQFPVPAALDTGDARTRPAAAINDGSLPRSPEREHTLPPPRASKSVLRVAAAHASALDAGIVPNVVDELRMLLEMLVLPPDDALPPSQQAQQPPSVGAVGASKGPGSDILRTADDARLYASAVLENATSVLPGLGERLLEALAEGAAAAAAPTLAERAADALAAARRASLRGGRASLGGGSTAAVSSGGDGSAASGASGARAWDANADGAGATVGGATDAGARAKRTSNRESARDAFCSLLRQARAADAYAFDSARAAGGRAAEAELRQGALALMGDLRADNVAWLANEIVSMMCRAAARGEADEEVVEIAGNDARLQQLHQRLTGPAAARGPASAQRSHSRAAGGRPPRRVGAGGAHGSHGSQAQPSARRALIPGSSAPPSRGGRSNKRGGTGGQGGSLSNSAEESSRLARYLPESQAAYARLVEVADSHKLNTHLRAALLRAVEALVDRSAVEAMLPSAFTERTLELRALLALLAIVEYGPACGGTAAGWARDVAGVDAILDTAEAAGASCFLLPAAVEFLRVAHVADASLFMGAGALAHVPARLAGMRRAAFVSGSMAAPAKLALAASVEAFLEATGLPTGDASTYKPSSATPQNGGLDAMAGLIDARYVAVVCPSLDALRLVLPSASASPSPGGAGAAAVTPRRRITPFAPARVSPTPVGGAGGDEAATGAVSIGGAAVASSSKRKLHEAFMAKQPTSVITMVHFVVDSVAVNAADAQLEAAVAAAAAAARADAQLGAVIAAAAEKRRQRASRNSDGGSGASDNASVQVDAAAVALAEEMAVPLRERGARAASEAAAAAAANAIRSLAPPTMSQPARDACASIASEAASAEATDRFLRNLGAALRKPLQDGARAELVRMVRGAASSSGSNNGKGASGTSEGDASDAGSGERMEGRAFGGVGGVAATSGGIEGDEGGTSDPGATAKGPMAEQKAGVDGALHTPVAVRASAALRAALSQPRRDVPSDEVWALMVATAEEAALAAELRAMQVTSLGCPTCASRLQGALEELVDGLQAAALERGESVTGGVTGDALPAPRNVALEGWSLQLAARGRALAAAAVEAACSPLACAVSEALDRVWAALAPAPSV